MIKKSKKEYPTLERIAKETEKIRNNWDDRTRLIRSGLSPEDIDEIGWWTPPMMSYKDLLEALQDRSIQISDKGN